MSFDWTQYLFLAQELLKDSLSSSNNEAMLRSGISRAYYAAFCSARNFLRDQRKKVIPSTAQAHGIVKGIFEGSTNTLELEIATDLDRLRIDRNKADCEDAVHGLDSMSKFALRNCQNIFLNLRALQNK
jgi:uncharacterized protein (UPF0332 family)